VKFEWEVINNPTTGLQGSAFARAKVFGGWIVKSQTWDNVGPMALSESMTFIPDILYSWKIDKDE
jgi:hypothetical protein